MTKKKKAVIAIIIILFLLFLIFVALCYLLKTKKLLINKYFIKKTDTIGVDLSVYQGDVNMQRLKEQNIKFVYIKATEGSSHVDRYFQTNWENAANTGLVRGAYHFFSFDSSGKTQAQNFIATVGDLEGSLLPVVDVEYYADKKIHPPKREAVVKELRSYIKTIEAEYGVKPMIYAPRSIEKKFLKGDFKDCTRWRRSVYYHVFIDAGNDWEVWQYTDLGELEGFNGDQKYIDLNVLNRKIKLEDITVFANNN
ncbi:MAG: glycosyl hydrolase family 25 [Lachnospiraceae bacterium]|nr:glycosyl hydrolase family 25 [Lachnospiraceae bacterium]